MIENLIHHCGHTVSVTHAELIKMNHQIIQPVKVKAEVITSIKWVDFLIASVKVLGESAKNCRYPDIEFAAGSIRAG